MRTAYFPIENENRETIKYLLDVYLAQTGAITFDTANGRITVEVIENPEDTGYWHPDVTYIIKLWKRPERCKYSRAKYIGFTTKEHTEVLEYLINYRDTAEDECHHTKRVKFKSKAEAIPERL